MPISTMSLRGLCRLAIILLLASSFTAVLQANAQPLAYPQIIKTRYEAKDPRVGGQFLLWVEREKIFYGLDPRLYPTVKYVEITHVTPSPGSPLITVIEVMTINSTVPEFFHLAGIVRLKVAGMTAVTSNAPQ